MGGSDNGSADVRVLSTTIEVRTHGPGFIDVTRDVTRWLAQAGAEAGIVTLFIRHTSASLLIQENADVDVQRDLLDALRKLAPEDAPYRHASEGPDDMPAHIKAMVMPVSLSIPVARGRMSLGTWQGIYVAEHRTAPHRRLVAATYIGLCR